MTELIIKVNESKFGPVSFRKLQDLIKQGLFAPHDLVWIDRISDWVSAESITEFKKIFGSDNGGNGGLQNKIYAFASGKGGVGKTALAASIGVGLATMGSEVILVDGDFGGANLHTCMGILEPELSFFDYYCCGQRYLNDIAVETPVPNLRLISGGYGTSSLSSPKYYQKQRLIRGLKKLHANHIIMDLGSGSSFDVIDFFLLADERFVVVTTDPSAVNEAFAFIKVSLFRALKKALKGYPEALEIIDNEATNRPSEIQLIVEDILYQVQQIDLEAASIFESVLQSFRPKLILNKVKNQAEIREGMAIQVAARELLSIEVDYLGYISFDPTVSEAVRQFKPVVLYDPRCKASQDITALIRGKLLGEKGFWEIFRRHQLRRHLKNCSKNYPHVNLLENAPICSDECFYWGNCDHQEEGHSCRVRLLETVLTE
ncbi:MAG: P-loop NTPase [bacterium]